MEATISGDFASQKNVLVNAVSCLESTDADHFSCRVSYETAEGVKEWATVNVACDSSRCVWRES